MAPDVNPDTYDVTITDNVFRNTPSYAIALQGNSPDGNTHTIGTIDISGNTFESWAVNPQYSNVKYSAFKIWNDSKLAPTQNSVPTLGNEENVTPDAFALKNAIIANNTFGAAMEGKAKVNFYDFYFFD